jgi:mono/diheme cytochrome c family protein
MNARKWMGLLFLLVVGMGSGCRKGAEAATAEPTARAYDKEADWSDSQRVILLNYQQAQGKRVFYQYCVWCHADATPAGPSNRSNLTPVPALLNDGAALNAQSDESLQNIITLGGSAMGKSAMMPPYGRVLSPGDIRAVIAFTRAVAQPIYQPTSRPSSEGSTK